MADQKQPGILGTANTAYAGSGTVVSDDFVPREHSTTVTIGAKPTTAGTCRVFYVDLDGVEHAQGSAAVAGTANVLNHFGVAQALGSFAKVRLKFVDTSATPGTVTFFVTDGL